MKYSWGLWCGAVLWLASLPAFAVYKVVGPDGKVTYTDRPAVQSRSVIPIKANGSGAEAVALPHELKEAVHRYPVVLYVLAADCAACDSARQFLKERGIPFAEKQISTNEDLLALEKLSGSRDAPVLTIGSQMLQGYTSLNWASYLDAPGYPAESKLPPQYTHPAPVSLTERRVSAASGSKLGKPKLPPAEPSTPIQPKVDPSGIRF